VPAGVLAVVVSSIAGIPAKHHVAKAKTFFENAGKLFETNELATQNAINIGNGYFYLFGILFG